MASTTRSCKAKGKRLQNEVRDFLLEHFTHLEPDDVLSTTMGDPGTDIKLSPAARKAFPFSVECKNRQSLNIWAALKQSEANVKPETTPCVIFKRNHSDTYITMKFDAFMKIYLDKKQEG
jgi:hypothetical protein